MLLNLCILLNKKLVFQKSVTKSQIVTKCMVTKSRFHCIRLKGKLSSLTSICNFKHFQKVYVNICLYFEGFTQTFLHDIKNSVQCSSGYENLMNFS